MKSQLNTITTILGILTLSVSTNLFALEAKPIATDSKVNAFNIEQGKKIWGQTFTGKAPFLNRSCTSCHGEKLVFAGKHIRTNKLIEPMAQSTNPKRFTNTVKVDKWFLRNCKWTIGRECTDQEKSNITAYLKTL